jgi:hypothetical protein
MNMATKAMQGIAKWPEKAMHMAIKVMQSIGKWPEKLCRA